jgi:hypothetical protein
LCQTFGITANGQHPRAVDDQRLRVCAQNLDLDRDIARASRQLQRVLETRDVFGSRKLVRIKPDELERIDVV